ncbi:hypothetical protein LINPERHAP2_LOCUS9190, partial [Linum perenne]
MEREFEGDSESRSTIPAGDAYELLEQRFRSLEQQNAELTQMLKTVIAQQAQTLGANTHVRQSPQDSHLEVLQQFLPATQIS